ncbi:formate dehydrogenase subunit delta [Pacificibacter marinus]|uniref:NADH-dependent formate dehydrogenase delta subunit FdsD n=1 Tax=Pacificibacter marinus TaxID=658057 RepID=A0A1Y5S6A4_9RHOB|nr:formate dehydrogenase subunit delta [Pacificibacter marinus]SEK92835.1 formate dehydrogenase subunit delta [Pacificibacter marinus]SLN30730.1 NADH-dependent formate dehydrogenase delta subunit FdsD [Pacificibacter marinus]
MSPDSMIRMANQIAAFFKTQPKIDQTQGVADHISDFWDPRMKAQLIAFVASDGTGLDEIVVQASHRL